jgi:hypothetical protein
MSLTSILPMTQSETKSGSHENRPHALPTTLYDRFFVEFLSIHPILFFKIRYVKLEQSVGNYAPIPQISIPRHLLKNLSISGCFL